MEKTLECAGEGSEHGRKIVTSENRSSDGLGDFEPTTSPFQQIRRVALDFHRVVIDSSCSLTTSVRVGHYPKRKG